MISLALALFLLAGGVAYAVAASQPGLTRTRRVGAWTLCAATLVVSAFLFFGLGVMCGAGPLSSCAVLQ